MSSGMERLIEQGKLLDRFTSIMTRAKDTRYMERVRSSHLIGLPITLLIFDRHAIVQPGHFRKLYLSFFLGHPNMDTLYESSLIEPYDSFKEML
jgi:hypothetical protein